MLYKSSTEPYSKPMLTPRQPKEVKSERLNTKEQKTAYFRSIYLDIL